MTTVVVDGFGLHTGAPVRVVLEAQPGRPVTLGQRTRRCDPADGDREGPAVAAIIARIDELSVVSTERATTVAARDGSIRVGTVEHVFAALAGMGIHEGLAITVDGPEMPLLDGAAAAWCRAIASLGVAPSAHPPLRVRRRAVLHAGASTYEFGPGESVDVAVAIDFGDARILPTARWTGDVEDFRQRIAPARTFAFERDIDDFVRRGLARHVAPEAVVVVTPAAILSAGAPFASDEPARHKLLDLLGDLYVRGGPPRGRLRVVRPGHAVNDRALTQALAEGIVGPV